MASGGEAVVIGRQLWALPHLPAYFPEFDRLERRAGPQTRAVLAPAEGADAQRADEIARRLKLERWVVRPGPLASIGGPHSGAAPISLVAGAMYPAVLLGQAGWETPDLIRDARELIAQKRTAGLSQFSGGAPWSPPAPSGRTLILAAAATAYEPWPGSAAGLCRRLLETARRDHPDAHLILWGGSDPLADSEAPADCSLMALIEQVDGVYVEDSLVGLDALTAGKPVVCLGTPFYAGIGLTDDRAGPSPAAARSLEAVFAAAYLLTPRYVDPLTGEACSPRTAIQRLAGFKRHADRVRGRWVGLDLPPPKQPVIRGFLAGPQSTYAAFGPVRRGAADCYAVWAAKDSAVRRRAERAAPDSIVRIEDGFIRSVGLGSSFHPAWSLILDRRGIYYDPSRPSDLDHVLDAETFSPELLAQAVALRQAIIGFGLSKYNLPDGAGLKLDAAQGRRVIFVPGQVEDDASVRTGGAGLSNQALLEQVRQAEPEAFILYKEHPDVTAGNRRGRIPAERLGALADMAVRNVSVLDCIAAADETHTLTSLAGFEALLRGKPVVTYGRPFYAGRGLTADRYAGSWPARRARTLDELVAGALIVYPLYLDPITRLPCDALTYVERLDVLRRAAPAPRPRGPWLRVGQGLRSSLFAPRPPLY